MVLVLAPNLRNVGGWGQKEERKGLRQFWKGGRMRRDPSRRTLVEEDRKEQQRMDSKERAPEEGNDM